MDRFVAGFIGETNFIRGKCLSATGDTALVELDCGDRLTAGHSSGVDCDAPVTIAVRPEHATLIGNVDDGHLAGEIASIVYVGTDTHVHLKLNSGEDFVIRKPNQRGAPITLQPGQKVGVLIADGAAQVLID